MNRIIMSAARVLKIATCVSIAFSLFIYIVLRSKLGSSVLYDFPHIGKLIHAEFQLEERNGTTVNQNTEPPTNITTAHTMETLFIQRTLNKTFVSELRKKVEKILQPWQVMQIFRANVEPKHMIQRKKYKDINKTDALRVTDEFQHRLNSCALVGNSGILLNSSCGDVIDHADIIIRMNLANYSDEYSSDVGSRVSFMTINGEQVRQLISCFVKTVKNKRTGKKTTEIKSESLDKLPAVCGNLIGKLSLLSNDSVLWPSRGHLRKLVGLLPVLRGRFHLNFTIGYNPASLIGTAIRLWRFRKPSSGLTLFSASILLCEETSLFGFYPFYTDQYNRTIPHHYYEPEVQMNYTTNAHAIPDEYKFLMNLENKGAIRMINNCTANSSVQHV